MGFLSESCLVTGFCQVYARFMPLLCLIYAKLVRLSSSLCCVQDVKAVQGLNQKGIISSGPALGCQNRRVSKLVPRGAQPNANRTPKNGGFRSKNTSQPIAGSNHPGQATARTRVISQT